MYTKITAFKIRTALNKELWIIFINDKEKYITPNQVINNLYVLPQDFCKA